MLRKANDNIVHEVRLKVFWDPAQLLHAPRFFLQRGVVRANFEVPARAEALLDGCRALPNVQIRWGHRVDAVTPLNDGVQLSVSTAETGLVANA